jgi:O-methyltransferase involved in polyketide biosynthesis
MRALVEGQPSRTAMVVVLMRAAHTRSGRPSLIEDPWSDRLVPEAMHAFEAERILTAAGFLGRWRLRLLLRSRQAIVDFGGHETLNPHPVRHVNRKSVNRSTNQARCRGR